jgi:hypothetical protein
MWFGCHQEIISSHEKSDEYSNLSPDFSWVTWLCGNEDCGQMSAWYLFRAIGFYPFNPVDSCYYFGSP